MDGDAGVGLGYIMIHPGPFPSPWIFEPCGFFLHHLDGGKMLKIDNKKRDGRRPSGIYDVIPWFSSLANIPTGKHTKSY